MIVNSVDRQKAFKGKGAWEGMAMQVGIRAGAQQRQSDGHAEEWLRRSNRDYERVLQEMNLVSEQSRRMNGNAWYLFLHYRKATGQRFLQWRSFGTPHVHMTWDRINPVVQTLGEAQRQWFVDANERAEVLNAREQVARRAVQMAQGIVAAVPG